MGRKAKELGALAVSRLSEAGLHFVGGVSGLGLQVLPSGGRDLRRRDGDLGLGVLRLVVVHHEGRPLV